MLCTGLKNNTKYKIPARPPLPFNSKTLKPSLLRSLDYALTMQSSAKENPNPVVHTTQRSTSSARSSLSQSLGYEAIRRYNLGAPSPTISTIIPDESSPFTSSSSYLSAPPTAEEHSVAIALSEAAYAPTSSAAADSSLDVLQRAGFALFHPQRMHKECRAIRFPSYSPASVTNPTPRSSSLDAQHNRDEITSEEVFDIIRNIQDPEHPLTLEQLNVVRIDLVDVVDLSVANDAMDVQDGQKRKFSTVHVQFCPTIPHCSMATLIGLSISVKLLRSLPPRFKVLVKIEPGTHVSEHAINKQLEDKERVRAALENDHLLGVVNRCIAGGMKMQ
jgi:metal-sulfur cluster biosynthetic enzyme